MIILFVDIGRIVCHHCLNFIQFFLILRIDRLPVMSIMLCLLKFNHSQKLTT